ncbi:MAG: DUF6782 family putative metallopeptidase [Alphaproteobacteria bacterium]
MGKDFDRESESVTKKPETRRFKDTSKRLRAGPEKPLKHRATLDWRLDQRSVCDKGGAAADVVSIDELKAVVLKSRTGEALFENNDSLVIIYDQQSPASQYYARGDQRIITLNPLRPKGDLVNLLARELRRDWQHRHGALVNPLVYEPDEAILINRAQSADVLMIGVKIAWELKLAGETDAWDFLTASPLVDVTRTFEIKAQADFRTLANGEASRAAYDKFFEDSRTKLHDKRIIHQMLLDESGYMKTREKSPKLSMDLFKRLGEIPHGRNYLSMKAKYAPTDLCYSTVEDRSNANFLWFIKFERSFQEKELQMIKDSVKLSAEVVDFGKWSDKTKRARQPEPGQ